MSDCLIDEALRYCDDALLAMSDTPLRGELRGRFRVLERATWSLTLLPTSTDQVVRIAKLVLTLRDDIESATAEAA